MAKYIYQYSNWPNFTWNEKEILALLGKVRHLQGKIFVPIHWGTFDLADEPLDEPPRLLFEEVEKQGLDKSLFWQLKHGETRIISSDEGERMAIAAEVQEEK